MDEVFAALLGFAGGMLAGLLGVGGGILFVPALSIFMDRFFDLEETLSWMQALPRMEAHILDGPHFLLETHAAECARLMRAFLARVGAGP